MCFCKSASECACALCISSFHQINKEITILLTPGYVRAAEGSKRGCRSDARDPQACTFIPFPLKNGVFIFAVLWSSEETQRAAEVITEREFGNGKQPSQWLSILAQ